MQPETLFTAVRKLADEGTLGNADPQRVAQRLAELLEPRNDRGHLVARIVATLGGVLVAAALLSFLAFHWDELGRHSRVAIALGGVGLLHAGGWWFAIASPRAPAVGAALTAAAMAGGGGAIAVIAQAYHLESRWQHGLLAWWLLNLPFVLLSANRLFALIEIGVFGAWAIGFGNAWARYQPGDHDDFAIPFTVLGAAAVVLAAAAWARRYGREQVAELAAAIARVALASVAFFLSFRDVAQYAMQDRDATGDLPHQIATSTVPGAVGSGLALLLCAAAVWKAHDRSARRDEPLDVAAASACLGALALFAIAWPTALHWCANGLLVLLIVGWIMRGVRCGRVIDVNLAVITFVATVLGRYFEWTPEGIELSATFLGAGVVLLAVGWFSERTRRHLVARAEGARE